MPYIDKPLRMAVDDVGPNPDKAGEINYYITLMLQRNLPASLFRHNLRKLFEGMWNVKPSYERANRFFGAVVLAFREYYRRTGDVHPLMGPAQHVMDELYTDHVAPYEDKKIAENGDLEYYEIAAAKKEAVNG